MKNELIKIVKKINGNVLVIGFREDDKLIDIIEKNKKVTSFFHISNKGKNRKGKRKLFGNKTINIKKLYKEVKKQKQDYIICEFEVVKPFLNNFIKNTYKLTNKKVYFLLDEKLYDYEELENRYNRYGAVAISKTKDNEYLIDIDMIDMKMPFYKRIIFNIRDFFYNIVELIASIIIS